MNEKSRALAFLLYDPDGICDESTLHTLRGFRPFVDHMFVVSNGPLQEESRQRVAEIADEVLERDNIGYDVGAYQDAFREIGWDRLAQFDELLMVNYTFFGPITDFGDLFAKMDRQDVDFWGITDHPAVTPNPYTGKGTMPGHLQSFWLGVRGNLLSSPDFREYWDTVQTPQSYSDVVVIFETQFTEYFASRGYTWQAAYPADAYGVENSAMEAPLALLEDGCPLFKKRLYFHDVPALAQHGVLSGDVTREAVAAGYPADLIVDGVSRRATARELSLGMAATYLVPPATEDAEDKEPALAYTQVEGSPWQRLAQSGVADLLGDAEVLLVDTPGPLPGKRSEVDVVGFRNARAAILADPGFVTSLLADNPRLAAVFPFIQYRADSMSGRAWFPRIENSLKIAELLEISGPYSQTSVLAPFHGIGAYRRELLAEMAGRIDEVGGWESVVEVAGSDEAAEQILNLLAGDLAKDMGMFVGQAGTADEVAGAASVLQDMYSRRPVIYDSYADYPYAGHVISPSFKNRIGMQIRRHSPRAFEQLHAFELQLRDALGKARKAVKR